MELFAEIRREYQFGIGTIKGVSRKLGVHRRVVRQALADAVPPARAYQARAKPTLARVQDFIDQILVADRLAPRKQRHTARRIYDRLCRERPEAPVAASTVRKYVGGWKRAQGLSGQLVCVPQTYGLGPRGPGRLVRSGRDPRRRGGDAAGVKRTGFVGGLIN